MNLEENLRAAVRDLAADAPPARDLAATARTRGRRLRRRRQAGLGAAAVALVASVITPYAVLHRTAPAPRPVVTRPTTSSAAPVPRTVIPSADWWKSPVELPGGVVVTAVTRAGVGTDTPAGSTVHDGNLVLDRSTGRYTVLGGNYYTVWGAPAGNRAAVDDGASRLGIVTGGGQAKWLSVGYALEPQWSSDGTRLLLSTLKGFAVVDVATRAIHRHTVPEMTEICPDICLFTWLPGGRQVAIARTDPNVAQSEGKPDTIKDIVVYDAGTGRRVRVVPVAGVPMSSDAWSPDGRAVLITTGGSTRIADVATGRTIGSVPRGTARFLPDGRILAIDDTAAGWYDVTGKLVEQATLPADFRGRTLSIGPA